jgi:23S rRNA pseudouridine2605 synthase
MAPRPRSGAPRRPVGSGAPTRPPGTVSLERALSKLGIASRSEARALIVAGRVAVDGRSVRDPRWPVVPERVRVTVDAAVRERAAARTIVLHKPRGVVTTRRDPEGRPTAYDLVRDAGRELQAVGRLDLASSGLLLFTTDTRLAAGLTDPANAVPRVYVVTVRGEVSDAARARLTDGLALGGGAVAPRAVTIRKRSARETHLIVELVEGRNREIRRLFAAVGHEVTRLLRVSFGAVSLGTLPPGRWRDLADDELAALRADASSG